MQERPRIWIAEIKGHFGGIRRKDQVHYWEDRWGARKEFEEFGEVKGGNRGEVLSGYCFEGGRRQEEGSLN